MTSLCNRSLAKEFARFAKEHDKKMTHEYQTLIKASMALRLRAEAVQSIVATKEVNIQLDQVKLLLPLVAQLFQGKAEGQEFPIDLEQFKEARIRLGLEEAKKSTAVKDLVTDDDAQVPQAESAKRFVGTRVKLCVEKIGLKDADDSALYINSHFLVMVVDIKGRMTEPEKNTNFASRREDKHMIFEGQGCTLELEQSLEELEQTPGCAVFFLFNHYKNKGGGVDGEGHVSTKCYSFMELDELKVMMPPHPDETIN